MAHDLDGNGSLDNQEFRGFIDKVNSLLEAVDKQHRNSAPQVSTPFRFGSTTSAPLQRARSSTFEVEQSDSPPEAAPQPDREFDVGASVRGMRDAFQHGFAPGVSLSEMKREARDGDGTFRVRSPARQSTFI
eukprot:COSAG01_NODE_1666_length_9571_cov_4.915963_8_plen_132_part_00